MVEQRLSNIRPYGDHYKPLELDKVDLKLQLRNHTVSLVQVYVVENDIKLDFLENPVQVKGSVLVENTATAMNVHFTYYHSILKIDLSPFPLEKSEVELIKSRIIEICMLSYINIGEHKLAFSPEQITWAYIKWVSIGLFVGATLACMIKG